MASAHAILVIGLGFGDCGKGSIVDFLARRHSAHTVVRFNGGPQAGHNVVTADGRHHTFSQFGSAALLRGVRTVLSRFMLIEPYALLNEAMHLREIGAADALDRLIIDERCAVITPAHQIANRLREQKRGSNAHGTCGLGIGEAMQDLIERPEMIIRASELGNRDVIVRKLREMVKAKDADCDFASVLSDISWIDAALENYTTVARRARIVGGSELRAMLSKEGTTIYEGAQGVLLDQDFGFHPHTTWSHTTFANAQTLLEESGFTGRTTRVGVLRSYCTRHGAGPMPTEDDGLRPQLREPHNSDTGAQGRFRVGAFDAVAARYALRACGGVDGMAITHLDRLCNLPPRICTGYRYDDETIEIPFHAAPTLAQMEQITAMLRKCRPVFSEYPNSVDGFVKVIEQQLGPRVMIRSTGPTADDKSD